jgi:hypothetical protein
MTSYTLKNPNAARENRIKSKCSTCHVKGAPVNKGTSGDYYNGTLLSDVCPRC